MVEVLPLTIPSLSGRKKRRVYVYLPEKAKENPKARFPVLYMFDGHNVFFDKDATYGKSWGMKDFMDRTELPLIIVAVECNHGKNYARLKEYSPFDFEFKDSGLIEGKGEKYMRWLIKKLKPITDENYPTLPDREHTYIAGSSMGGLMSLYAVLQHNDVFSRGACLSPSLWTNPEKVNELIETADVAPDTVLYMDYGENEMKRREKMGECYINAVHKLLDKGILLTSRIVPGGEHCESSWEKQLPLFLSTLMYAND
ncbi:MAG: alpha/beta hydrolase [Clostridia bacterium]|nr:alpha/beta hydrolase [Clostridia bacterium]